MHLRNPLPQICRSVSFLGFLVIALALPSFVTGARAAEDQPPNFVFILVDDLGYGDLSSFGAPDLKTPNIDRLMAAGMRFDQFYANCPVCSPTRAALLSGRYPDMAGVPGVIRTRLPDRVTSWGKLSEDVVLLPQVLKPSGYHSAIVGKWHLGLDAPDRPTDRGFDFFHGFLGDMMDDYYTHLRHGQHYMRRNTEPVEPEGHATDIFTGWAIDYLNERAAAPETPFFLYLAYNAPHTPIQPPQDWLEKVQAREPGISEQRAKLVALIEHLDDGVGQVWRSLQDLGLAENTVIVFSSDNGGQKEVGARNDPLHGGKQEMWEGGIRVCTGVVWPGKIEPGQRTQQRAMTMDFYPTFAEIAGAKIEHEIDGRSLLPILLGEETEDDLERPMVWVRLEGGKKYGGLHYHAIRKGDFKLLRNTGYESYQLFNVARDPGEENPIPENKAPRVYNELFNLLTTHINHAGKVPWQRPDE